MTSRLDSTHESCILTYGHFGTATYDRRNHSWHFVRLVENNQSTENLNNGERKARAPNVHCLAKPQTCVPASRLWQTLNDHQWKPSNRSKHAPEIAPALSLTDDDIEVKADGQFCRHNLRNLTFGNIPVLDQGTRIADSALLPVAAFSSGMNGENLSIAALSSDFVSVEDTGGKLIQLELPSLSPSASQSWEKCQESILQIDLSCPTRSSRRNDFFAIRRPSSTTILSLTSCGPPALSTMSNASIHYDLEEVIKLPMSVTGGATQVDMKYHPRLPNIFAIVDVEGNWSIWAITGRRHFSAKQTYRMILQTYGRLFAWGSNSRPKHVGLFFDGWHQVRWIGGRNETTEQLLVCNRRQALIFSFEGEELGWLDCRLGRLRHGQMILDVHSFAHSPYCLVLTSSLLLLFDLSQKEWKRSQTIDDPLLAVAWRHFQAGKDLKMATLKYESHIWAITYSSNTVAPMMIYHFQINRSKDRAGSYDPSILDLKLQYGIPISSIEIKLIDFSQTVSPNNKLLSKVFIIYADLSIDSALLELPHIPSKHDSDMSHSSIALPSLKLHRYQSQKYIIDDDMSDFIDENYEETASTLLNETSTNLSTMNEAMTQSRNFDISRTYRAISSSTQSTATNQALLRDTIYGIDDILFKFKTTDDFCTTPLSSLIAPDVHVEDIDRDAEELDSMLESLVLLPQLPGQVGVRATSFYTVSGMTKIYERLIEKYVAYLPGSVPSRIRLQRERNIRKIALDLHLSQYLVVRNDEKGVTQDAREFPNRPVQSDPADHIDNEFNQTTPRSQNDLDLTTIEEFSLSESLRRLYAYTTISRPPSNPLSATTSEILAHLPSDPTVNPDEYDYENVELAITVSRNQALDEALDPRTRRKMERLARARQRALDRVEQVRQTTDSQNMSTPSVLTSHTQLPLRQAQSSQLQPASSQASGKELSMTQPERGMYGKRPKKGKGKKPQRPAGFR